MTNLFPDFIQQFRNFSPLNKKVTRTNHFIKKLLCNPNEVKYLQVPYPHLAFMDCRNYLFLSFGNTTPLSSHWLSFYALSINRGLQTVVILLLTYFSKFMTWLQDSAQRRQKEMQKALNHTSPQRRSVPDTILTPPSSNRKPRILRWAEPVMYKYSRLIWLATQLAILLVFRQFIVVWKSSQLLPSKTCKLMKAYLNHSKQLMLYTGAC